VCVCVFGGFVCFFIAFYALAAGCCYFCLRLLKKIYQNVLAESVVKREKETGRDSVGHNAAHLNAKWRIGGGIIGGGNSYKHLYFPLGYLPINILTYTYIYI